jgi:hypothetical protein
MSIVNIVFIIIIAFAIAKLEIQIEGKDGWAKNLPTWKNNNKLTNLIIGKDYPLTGYHLWAFITLFLFIQFPFFMGMPFSIQEELKLISMLFLIAVLEDFLWFVLNPAYGIRKFNSKEVKWHKWVSPLPLPYIILLSLTIIINYFFL